MNISELENKIAVIKKGIDSSATPENQKELFKKTLVTLEKQLEDAKAKETKTEAPKKKRVKKERTPSVAEKKRGIVSKMDVSKDKASVTYKGKTYSIDECDDLFKAWNMKKKAAAKSSEKSESKPTTEKILDKSETTLKQVLADKSVKKKIKENPKQAKRELVKVEKTMRAFLDAVEEFLGKKIPESKVNKVFAFFKEIDLMEMGGALTYADVYEGNLSEFADGGEIQMVNLGTGNMPLEDAIKMYEDKIKAQGRVTNERDEDMLKQLKAMRNKMAHGGRIDLKEDDFVWNALGNKLIVDKVTKDEYYLTSFGQPFASPFSKEKVNNYIKNGEWTLSPPKMAHGGQMGNEHEYIVRLQNSESGDMLQLDVLGMNEKDAIKNAFIEADLNQPYEFYSIIKKKSNGGSMSDNSPKIYVADLAAYNDGRLVGQWLDLSDYNDGSEVMDAITELLGNWSKESGEEREEFAIHDYENFDSSLYSEYMGEGDFDKVIKVYNLSEKRDVPMSVISYIIREYDPNDVEEWYDEHFEGQYDSDTDLAYGYIDMIGGLEQLGQGTLETFFDYESFGRDLAYDYTEVDGYYFRTYKRGGSIKKYDLSKYYKKK